MIVAGDSGRADRDPARPKCLLCLETGGEVVWRDSFARVVLVGDVDYPGLCRAIVNRHVREMTDLGEAERARLMQVVYAVETAQRLLLCPDKINLASLGNQIGHVHWHVIPRFADDPHYPNAVWGARASGKARPLPERFAGNLAIALVRVLGR